MNSDCQQGNGGDTITPSARRGIHCYRENNIDMGRYGLKNEKNRNNRAASPPHNDDQGIDVVDNVQSKMAHQTSPLSIRRKKLIRTHSYTQEEDHSDDNSDGTELEELHYSTRSLSQSKQLEDSYHSQILNRSNQSTDLQSSPYQRNLSASLPLRSSKTESNSRSLIYVFLTPVILGIIAVICFKDTLVESLHYNKLNKSTQTDDYSQTQFENNMNLLREKYNIDQNSMLKLKIGLSTIFSRMDAGSFMFVYNSNANNFDPVEFDKFINEVAYTAARYLRHEIPSNKHTVLSSSLDMQEHGELISSYRDAVDETGVLLVKEVDRVPSDLAMAFHYYCDEYDPLVKKSAIFFTLNLANCSNSSGKKKSTHDFIEKCLSGKWKSVPSENMRPLLTRVVDVVIDVTSGF